MDPVYIVMEIKTVEHEGGYAVVTDVKQFLNRNNAESRYHTVLASAANLTYPKHGAVLMTNEGFTLAQQTYAQPEPEPEPEEPTEE